MNLFDDDIDDDDIEDADAPIGASIPAPRANPDLVAHEALEKQMLGWWQSGTMPHTLVLSGPKGIGKATLAFRLARFLLANPTPGADMFGGSPESLAVSQTNPVFARVASAGHTDLMSLAREVNAKTGHLNNEILVDAVRTVPLFLRKTAGEGGWRVVIVDEAETLNRNAQNALLKILEEPPARALLILVTQSVGALVPTIRSRARVVDMRAPDNAAFTKLIRAFHPELSASDIDILSDVSGNAPGRAVELLDQGGMEAIREALGLLETLTDADDATLWTMAERLAVKGTPDALAGMLDLSCWRLQASAVAAAKADAPAPMRTALETLDKLERHRAICENGNLDRRHTALGALRILQQGMKAA